MKKGRFDTAKLAEWTKKVGTKIKETAEALEVEFNDDGTGGGEHAKHSIKGQSMMQQEFFEQPIRGVANKLSVILRVSFSVLVRRRRRQTTRTFR